MNISTGYSNLQSYQAQKSKIAVKQSSSPVSANSQSSPNFTGIRDFLPSINDFLIPRKNSDFYGFAHSCSAILRKDQSEIEKLLSLKTYGRMSFFSDMVEKYNSQNFYRTPENRENSDIVLKLFKRIKNPVGIHHDMTVNTDLSLTQESVVFEKLHNNPLKLRKACNIYADIRRIGIPGKNIEETKNIKNSVFMQMIESPNYEKYLSDYKTYRPYIRQNIQKEDVITKLDAKISSNRYDSAFADKSHALDETYKEMLNPDMVKKERLLPYFSKEGNELLPVLDGKFISKNGFSDSEQSAIINIYKTTTAKNLEMRKNFLNKSYFNLMKKEKYNKDEIQNIEKLFAMADKDPDTMRFLRKMQKESYVTLDASGYLMILEEIKPSVLNNNSQTAADAIRRNAFKSSEEKARAVTDSLKNKPQSFQDKFMAGFKNLFTKTGTPKQSDVSNSTGESVFRSNLNKETAVFDTFQSGDNANKAVGRKTGFSPKAAAAPSAKKLVVINDTDEIIKKKLGKNVYDDQQKTYARHATKMRLKLLPEIFDSIKDTRAAARKDGTFNRRTTVKNEDALYLYRRINGKNRRLVNYMLKLRNEDGTRKYNIRDIIETIDNTEKTAKAKQMTSPELRKKCFDAVMSDKIAEFGKLPITRTSKLQNPHSITRKD